MNWIPLQSHGREKHLVSAGMSQLPVCAFSSTKPQSTEERLLSEPSRS